jgi:hypothetical protein
MHDLIKTKSYDQISREEIIQDLDENIKDLKIKFEKLQSET